jgi:uncharacterized protein
MQESTLESFVRQHIDAHSGPIVQFAWQGGEPTLCGLDFFKRVVELQEAHSADRTIQIENALQTNGVLVDDDWARFFADHKFLVGLSIDGPADLHDRYRRDRGDQPTFDAVMRALDRLKHHDVAFNTLTVVNRHTATRPLEVYQFLKDAGSRFMQFIPVVERLAHVPEEDGLALVSPDSAARAAVTPWSVDPADFGTFLCTIFDEWVRHDVGRYHVQQFDVALEAWVGQQSSVCVFRETCGGALALEHNGDVYSCDHYVYPDHRLGNLLTTPLAELVASPQQKAFGDAKRDRLPAECIECDVRFACHGECPKHRFVHSKDGSHDLYDLCAGYKRFFRHVDPPMKFMARELSQRRAPANVMRWMAGEDHATAIRAAGRNDPCPCGSGRKFKKCCGAAAPK